MSNYPGYGNYGGQYPQQYNQGQWQQHGNQYYGNQQPQQSQGMYGMQYTGGTQGGYNQQQYPGMYTQPMPNITYTFTISEEQQAPKPTTPYMPSMLQEEIQPKESQLFDAFDQFNPKPKSSAPQNKPRPREEQPKLQQMEQPKQALSRDWTKSFREEMNSQVPQQTVTAPSDSHRLPPQNSQRKRPLQTL